MGIEIERKFLIDLNKIKNLPEGESIKQGYIMTQDLTTVRIRVVGERAYLTLKGANRGAVRSEFEYPIPIKDAEEILQTLCNRPIIEKRRCELPLKNQLWEIDIFEGENEGLVVAELELDDEDALVTLPEWITKEVTDDPKYYNVNLLKYPYQSWSLDEQ